ncbi:hypothetical protein JRO89_XS08G0175800 [Xanthoceras sorbifolium]|uniref:Uncharacterized protein n=1 Tax=Xanthoceras sorbifolium TaxID=99658 RepID=A0ABQ8HQ85_9ROSI|nr:hypothetical protein JRO89_XS08G0175800 [Xanthoceras sorbifolium]
MAFPLFSTPQPQQSQPLFQPQQQQAATFSKQPVKAPANYSTKWADLHPDSQKFLLQIEERILEYRDESQRLDQCSRLYDSSVSNEGFELDANHIVQELGGINTSMDRQKAQLQELMVVVKDMLRNTEVVVRSFMMLRPRFHHPNAGGASSTTAPSQGPGATATPGSTGQPTTTSIVPVFDFYRGIPKKPSPFLQQTIARFEKYLGECRQWIEELEQLLLLDTDRNSSHPGSSLLQSLPKIMANVHDFFVHVAAKCWNTLLMERMLYGKYLLALYEFHTIFIVDNTLKEWKPFATRGKVYEILVADGALCISLKDYDILFVLQAESIHQYVETMKKAYLADQRRRGDSNDPFLEADRRETAKLQAAAKRVHPTLHLPTNSQPSTQVAGLLTSAPTSGSGASVAPQTSATAPLASSGGGLSLFGTPSSTPASSMSSSLFATPTMSVPTSSLFGSSGASPQMSSSSLFAASTPSLFGNTAPAFGSTPSAGGSLFSTPFASALSLKARGYHSGSWLVAFKNFVWFNTNDIYSHPKVTKVLLRVLELALGLHLGFAFESEKISFFCTMISQSQDFFLSSDVADCESHVAIMLYNTF